MCDPFLGFGKKEGWREGRREGREGALLLGKSENLNNDYIIDNEIVLILNFLSAMILF